MESTSRDDPETHAGDSQYNPLTGMSESLDADALARILGPPVALDTGIAAPYLDVFNICTLKERNGKSYDTSEYTKLLIEPVAIPSLEHTGVHTIVDDQGVRDSQQTLEMESKRALFYANGHKKKNFRSEIRKAFRKAETGRATLDPIIKGNGMHPHRKATINDNDPRRVQAMCDEYLRRERDSIYCQVPPKEKLNIASYAESKRFPKREDTVVPHPAPRESDRTVKKLLNSIRRENQRMDALALIK